MMNLRAARLHTTQLEPTDTASAHDVVARFGALQAQEYVPSLWAVGQRISGGTIADVERAIADRQIVRLSFMRGTVHFVAGEDFRWMTMLMAERIRKLINNARHMLRASWTEDDFLRANDVIAQALSGGTLLKRTELSQILADEGFHGDHMGRVLLMQRAMADSVICYGTHAGKQARLALADEWLPPSPSYTREEALAEFARRYFQSHSPATDRDYAWWSGLTLTEARQSIASLGTWLCSETIGGETFWYAASTPLAPEIAPNAHLLQNYDEYLVAYKDRSFAFDDAFTPQLKYDGGIIFHHSIILCGRVVGTWTKTTKKDRVLLNLQIFRPLSSDETVLVEDAAQRYSTFWGINTDLRYD